MGGLNAKNDRGERVAGVGSSRLKQVVWELGRRMNDRGGRFELEGGDGRNACRAGKSVARRWKRWEGTVCTEVGRGRCYGVQRYGVPEEY